MAAGYFYNGSPIIKAIGSNKMEIVLIYFATVAWTSNRLLQGFGKSLCLRHVFSKLEKMVKSWIFFRRKK